MPAQTGDDGQRQQGQQIARQQIGVAEGAIDPDRAGADGVGISPARQFFGGGIQLPEGQHAAEQSAAEQGGQQPVPPQAALVEQFAHQGVNAQIADQFQQAFGCRRWHWGKSGADQGNGQKQQHPAADGADACRRSDQGPQEPERPRCGDFHRQAAAGDKRQAGQQEDQHGSRQHFQPLQASGRCCEASLPTQQQC